MATEMSYSESYVPVSSITCPEWNFLIGWSYSQFTTSETRKNIDSLFTKHINHPDFSANLESGNIVKYIINKDIKVVLMQPHYITLYT